MTNFGNLLGINIPFLWSNNVFKHHTLQKHGNIWEATSKHRGRRCFKKASRRGTLIVTVESIFLLDDFILVLRPGKSQVTTIGVLPNKRSQLAHYCLVWGIRPVCGLTTVGQVMLKFFHWLRLGPPFKCIFLVLYLCMICKCLIKCNWQRNEECHNVMRRFLPLVLPLSLLNHKQRTTN